MDPINYIQNVKNPFESAIQGYQAGLAIKQQQAAAAQAQAQQQAQLQMQADLGALAMNKNAAPGDYVSIMTKYPQLAEQLKAPLASLTEEQKQGKLNDASKIYSALQSGNSDIAKGLLTEQATALRNSGKEGEAKNAEAMAQLVELHPDVAKTTAALGLSAIMGPDKFASTFESLSKTQRETEKAPVELYKMKSEAETARIKAKFAEPEAVMELQTKGWNIKKLESDIISARESNRIAAMNAATNREGNSLKRQEMELKLQEEKGKIQDKLNSKVSEVESARSNIDNLLNTADKLLVHPGLEKATGSIASRLPSFRQDSADFDALMENLDAQAFLAQVPQMKGLGALSENEGKKLGAALQSFSTKQNPEQLRTSIKEAQRIMLKARKNLSDKYGVPETVPDTPAVKPSSGEIDALLKKYGGK